jgi:hypothetical protein
MAVNGQLHAMAALVLIKRQLVPSNYEVEWVPEIAWIFRRGEKLSLALAGIRTSDHSVHG